MLFRALNCLIIQNSLEISGVDAVKMSRPNTHRLCKTVSWMSVALFLHGPATTQNLVVKFEMLLTIFPSKRSSKISIQTSPEVRHQFRRKLRQLHSGNRWCLIFAPCSSGYVLWFATSLVPNIGRRFCAHCIRKPRNRPSKKLLGTRQGS